MIGVFPYLARYPSAHLLFVQLLAILVYPFVESLEHGRAIVGVFGIMVLVAAIRLVRSSPNTQWIALILAAFVLILTIAAEFVSSNTLTAALPIISAAFYFYAAFSLIRYMLEDLRATTDELFAVGATFTLLAWAFAHTYAACQVVTPHSFTAGINPESARTWVELLYLSFAVLSGVGLSDVSPLQPFARSVVMLEQFAGVMYIALVVTRLVALSARQR